MQNTKCEICAFENPKLCVTAVVVRDTKLLVARRNEEPFKDHWDFVGGYVSKNETPEEGLRRELKEELGVSPVRNKASNGVDMLLTYIGSFTGAVIGAGSVIMKDVLAREVWVGVPGKFLRKA